MIQINIPDWGNVSIHNIVLDFNGTIAKDGIMIQGVAERIWHLSEKDVSIFVITADTNKSVEKQCEGLPLKVEIYEKNSIAENKRKLVEQLGSDCTAAIGNGRNDLAMIQASKLSISIVGSEGCYTKSAISSDLIVTNILDALDLLIHTNRLTASLRG